MDGSGWIDPESTRDHLQAPDQSSLSPKTRRSVASRPRILGVLGSMSGPASAVDVARAAGISRVTARRYLEHLVETGRVDLSLAYGAPGRPEHRYRLRGPD